MPRQNLRPYKELGSILQSWREARFRSARELIQSRKWNFSYSTYADIEKGRVLPSPEIVAELSEGLEVDPTLAVLKWAELRMPNEAMKKVFLKVPPQEVLEFTPNAAESKAPSMENTWLFGPSEKKMLEKNPWFWELCTLLVGAYPKAVSLELLRSKGSGTKSWLTKIQPWIDSNHFQKTKEGLSVGYRHIYIPRTPAWGEIRKTNMERAAKDILFHINSSANSEFFFQGIVHRKLSPQQSQDWIERLAKLENDFAHDSYDPIGGEDINGLIMILGPRMFQF